MTNILRDVQGYMEFWGWTNGGGTNSVKIEDGRVIASHGDAMWIEDVSKAADAIGRIADRVNPPGRSPGHGHGGDGRRSDGKD
jgi:hypothetical protein